MASGLLLAGAIVGTPLASLYMSDNNTNLKESSILKITIDDRLDAQFHNFFGISKGVINAIKIGEGLKGIKERIDTDLTIDEVNRFKKSLIEKENLLEVDITINTFDKSVNRYRRICGVEENVVNINPLQGNETEIGGKKELLYTIIHEMSHSIFWKYKKQKYNNFNPTNDEKMNISLSSILKKYSTYDGSLWIKFRWNKSCSFSR